MIKKLLLQKTIIGGLCALICQGALASTNFTVCPSVDMLKKFDGSLVVSMPEGFDKEAQAMKAVVFQQRAFSENDTEFQGYGNLVFVMSSILIHEGEDPEKQAATILSNMQADFEQPLMFKFDADHTLPVCSYSVPGVETKAIVVQLPEDETFDLPFFAKR
ncbi:MAG: hypothetical protein CK424_02090 [Legionella sp.]|nr:MAG: hypothetical protein CK424_02090 [Legionella sp.]